MARISTHVLDIAQRQPAAGIIVELYRRPGTASHSEDKCRRPHRCAAAGRDRIPPGVYELVFQRRIFSGRRLFYEQSPFVSWSPTSRTTITCRCCWLRTVTAPTGDHERTRRQSDRLCRELAHFQEEPGRTTRTFLSPPMHDVHRLLGEWMRERHAVPSMRPEIYAACAPEQATRRLVDRSHLDTVPNAGAFDGILGVVLGIALIEALADRELRITIEVIGFSEEEGVRFGMPFIGSRALAALCTMRPRHRPRRSRNSGWNPADFNTAARLRGGFRVSRDPHRTGAGAGKPRLAARRSGKYRGPEPPPCPFEGKANHAGTTPAHLRHDALAAAAEWIALVEKQMLQHPGLVATVGKMQVEPNAANVIPGLVRLTLDVRHASDDERRSAVGLL